MYFNKKVGLMKLLLLIAKRIEVPPDFGWSTYNLAKTLAKQDKLSEALEAYQTASKLDPKLLVWIIKTYEIRYSSVKTQLTPSGGLRTAPEKLTCGNGGNIRNL
jgi:tetratricopeptide (TPR) repeat protein